MINTAVVEDGLLAAEKMKECLSRYEAENSLEERFHAVTNHMAPGAAVHYETVPW